MFLVYKLVQLALEPGLWIGGGLLACCFLARSTKRPVLGRRILFASTLLFLGLSTRPLSAALVLPLERRYGPISLAGSDSPVEAIVVLTGGAVWEPGTHQATIFGTPSLDRLIGGVVLLREGVAPRLVLTGGVADPLGRSPSESGAMLSLTRRLGVQEEQVVVDTQSRTTHESASEVRRLLPEAHRIVLVSSAIHLPRATALFRKQGFEVTPAPFGHCAPEGRWGISDFLPKGSRLSHSAAAIHEYVGYAVFWAQGRI